MYSLVAPHPLLFNLAQKLAALGTRLVSPFSDYVPLPAFTGWGYSKDLPRFAGKTFRERFAGLQAETYTGTQVDRYTGKLASLEKREEEAVIPDREALISQFTQELTKVGGIVVYTSRSELVKRVIDLLKARGVDHIHLEPDVLDEAPLQNAGITVSHTPDAALRVGVTKAFCGLADTGSVLVADGEGNPLQGSLLPEIHIAVLSTSDLLPSLDAAMSLPVVSQSRAAVVITGPSRTADIEMSLTIGMHGPAEVHVFLVHTIC
jgi:L-lactate dehydrogenase complex protein LldG